MTAWRCIDVNELPDEKTANNYEFYFLPDGSVWAISNDGDGWDMIVPPKCKSCNGTGEKENGKNCEVCDGLGNSK